MLVILHVDDFCAAGPSRGLTRMYAVLEKNMLMKVGEESSVGNVFELLRARCRREADGLRVTPSETYLDKCLADLGLEDGRSARHLGLMLREKCYSKQYPNVAEVKIYRRCVGRLLYISQTRFDIQYYLRTLCQDAGHPRSGARRT